MRLFELCVPRSSQIFIGSNTPLRILHLNDYVMEKAFVYGWVLLSKWIGKEHLDHGLYGTWPPKCPEHLLSDLGAAGPSKVMIDVDAAAHSQAILG